MKLIAFTGGLALGYLWLFSDFVSEWRHLLSLVLGIAYMILVDKKEVKK